MSDTTANKSTNTGVTIDPDPGFIMALDELTATEELGRPFLYVVMMSSAEAKGDLQSLVGSNMTISITRKTQSDKRYFNGIISRIEYAGLSGGAATYRVELRPWIWLLLHQEDCIVHQNKSAWEIITAVFQKAGFDGYQDKRQNSAGDAKLEYCVQYNESSLAFVTRLMEEFGIYYYYTHSSSAHTLVFCDDPGSHSSVGAAIPFQTQQTERRAVEDHIWQWSSEHAVVSGKVTYRDYDFTAPGADQTVRSAITATHKYGDFEVYNYSGRYSERKGVDNLKGETLSDTHIQDITARRKITFGSSNSRLLYSGCKFTLSNFYQDSENAEYMVAGATYTVGMAEGMATDQGEMRDTFRCTFQAIKADANFRMQRSTPRPMIRGPQTAVVVGAAGDEIYTDQYGRIKVQFPWDRVGSKDENSSCWVRVAHGWAGQGWGSIFIPRVGQEVVVQFLEGDPDRPIVTGCVYNANQTVPYALPDNKTRSTIKTNSSPGGSGFNELRFEDKAGSEEVFFQAQKDYNKVVLNNETVNITQDTTTTIKQGNRSITVSTGNDGLTVSQGDHSITVSAGKSTINAGTSITLQVGSNSITIDNSGVTISATKVTVTATGALSMSATGNMTLAGAMVSIN